MTEEEIELLVERKINNLDRLFLNGAISEKNYTAALKELHMWSETKYLEAKREPA